MESLLEELIEKTGLTEDDFLRASFHIYSQEEYRPFIEEMFSVDDFLFFKKNMALLNKKLDREVEGKNEYIEDEEDLQYALELSRKAYEETLALIDEEERMVSQAIELSKIEAQKSTKSIKNEIKDKILKEQEKAAERLKDLKIQSRAKNDEYQQQQEENIESPKTRKQRLLAQREALLRRKKEEREHKNDESEKIEQIPQKHKNTENSDSNKNRQIYQTLQEKRLI